MRSRYLPTTIQHTILYSYLAIIPHSPTTLKAITKRPIEAIKSDH